MSDAAPTADEIAVTTPPNKKVKDNGASVPESSVNKKIDKARKEKQQADWARVQKMDSVVLNAEKDNVVLIGGIPVKNWTSKMLPAFCRENGINVPEKRKTRSDCIRFIMNHMSGQAFRNKVATKGGKKISGAASTRPHAAPKDGTLLRVILTITHPEGRSLYIKTNDKLDRSELDKRTGHADIWKQLLAIYKDTSKSELDSIDVDLSEYGYSSNEAGDFDEHISAQEFSEVVRFMNYWYGKARSGKNTSGQHLDFESFVNGKGWLIFYHRKLEELGDTDVMNASYATLPSDVFNMSGCLSPSEGTVSTTGSRCTTSTGEQPSESDTTKQLLSAKKEVANAIVEKNKASLSLTMMQQKKIEMEVKESQEQNYEALDDSVFDMEESLVEVTMKMKNTDRDCDTVKWDSMVRYKCHLKRKVARARTKMTQLETIMKLDSDGKEDSEGSNSNYSDND